MLLMTRSLIIAACFALLSLFAYGEVRIDEPALGAKLGGWTKRSKQAAEYALSGATYRTYKPEVSPTPDGGIFVSLRIDHMRGWLASDDHAILEITINSEGAITSAQSSIAIQGRSISSDLIRMGADAGQEISGVERSVKIGTDLVADLSSKMLREKIVEAGRVSFPAVLRHNYNLLFQTIRVVPPPPVARPAEVQADGTVTVAEEPAPVETDKKPKTKKLEIAPYGGPLKVTLPTQAEE